MDQQQNNAPLKQTTNRQGPDYQETKSGNALFFLLSFQQLALGTDAAQVIIDPTGNLYHRLKHWAYSKNLDRRLVLIDPGEQRLVVGVNPIKPWSGNHHLQAALNWDLMRRAMDGADPYQTPLLTQWMSNALYGLITTGMTLAEAAPLLRFDDSGFREAMIANMPESEEQKEFEYLNQLVRGQSLGPAIREWHSQASAAHRRIRLYTNNEYLRLILGTTQNVINWGDVLDQGKIVLVNLNPTGPHGRALDNQDVRTFGLQLISSLIEETFQRTSHQSTPPPCYLYVDECQHFISADIERILAEGRQFNLRLMLACRTPQELIKDGDETLLRLVASCTQAKFVFGGLSHHDTRELAMDIYGHHFDLMKVKDEIVTQTQFSYLERVEDVTTTVGGSEGTSSATSEGSSSGYHESSGSSNADTSSRGGSESHSEFDQPFPLDAFGPDQGSVHNIGQSDSSSSTQSHSSASGSSSMESSSFSEAISEVRSWSESTVFRLMSKPGDLVNQVTGRTFFNIDEQLHEAIAKIVRQTPQHCIFTSGKDEPVEFRVADVRPTMIDAKKAHGLDLELMRQLPYYAEPKLIEEEIRDRRQKFLAGGEPKLTPIKPEHRTAKKKGKV